MNQATELEKLKVLHQELQQKYAQSDFLVEKGKFENKSLKENLSANKMSIKALKVYLQFSKRTLN